MINKDKNIVLIGMPAVGKSTVGVLLAKALCMDYCDTDLVFQRKTGSSLCKYISLHGSSDFILAEERAVCSINVKGSVIATGGSVVYGEKAMEKLKSDGVVVYIRSPLEVIKKRISDINSRGVVLTHGNSLEDLYKERTPLYERYADVTVDNLNCSAEVCVENIIDKLNIL